jgi:PHD/YefM family antitoxin component YafN of YafNO toxin-antitoxin module
MTSVNASYARANSYELIESALDEPVRITSRKGTVVMISEEELENILETIHLMGVPGLLEDIMEGRQMPEDKLIRWTSKDN